MSNQNLPHQLLSNETAKEIIIYTESHLAINNLTLSQWIFSRLFLPIRLGPINVRKVPSLYSGWIVTKMSGELQTLDLKTIENKKKKKSSKKKGQIISPSFSNLELTLSPTSSVYVTFPYFKIVFCLDVSRDSFIVLEDGGLPFDVLVESLYASIKQISYSLQQPDSYALKAFITIIAHRPAIDETIYIWQGEISAETDLNLLLSLLKGLISCVEEEVYTSRSSIHRKY
jgi:hypothetical protein